VTCHARSWYDWCLSRTRAVPLLSKSPSGQAPWGPRDTLSPHSGTTRGDDQNAFARRFKMTAAKRKSLAGRWDGIFFFATIGQLLLVADRLRARPRFQLFRGSCEATATVRRIRSQPVSVSAASLSVPNHHPASRTRIPPRVAVTSCTKTGKRQGARYGGRTGRRGRARRHCRPFPEPAPPRRAAAGTQPTEVVLSRALSPMIPLPPSPAQAPPQPGHAAGSRILPPGRRSRPPCSPSRPSPPQRPLHSVGQATGICALPPARPSARTLPSPTTDAQLSVASLRSLLRVLDAWPGRRRSSLQKATNARRDHLVRSPPHQSREGNYWPGQSQPSCARTTYHPKHLFPFRTILRLTAMEIGRSAGSWVEGQIAELTPARQHLCSSPA